MTPTDGELFEAAHLTALSMLRELRKMRQDARRFERQLDCRSNFDPRLVCELKEWAITILALSEELERISAEIKEGPT